MRKQANDWINEKRKELCELNGQTIENTQPTPQIVEGEKQERAKLKFRNAKGDKKALYYVLQQLAEKEILPKKDWLHIAEFLVQNVVGFESNKPDSIAGELSRVSYDPPKEKNQIKLPES